MEGRFRFYGLAIKQDLQKAPQTTGRDTGPAVATVPPQGMNLGAVHGKDPFHLASNVPKSYTSPTSGPFQPEQGVQVFRLLAHVLAYASSHEHRGPAREVNSLKHRLRDLELEKHRRKQTEFRDPGSGLPSCTHLDARGLPTCVPKKAAS